MSKNYSRSYAWVLLTVKKKSRMHATGHDAETCPSDMFRQQNHVLFKYWGHVSGGGDM